MTLRVQFAMNPVATASTCNQDGEIPTRFYLYEVYRDEAAFQAHLETSHFKEWVAVAKPMFDGEAEKVTMKTIFPSDDGWEKQKPALLNW